MRRLILLALALLPASLAAQTVTMPQSVKIARGRMVQVEISHDGDDFKWVTPPELDVFRGWSDSPNTVVLLVLAPNETPDGTYQIYAVTTKAVDGKGKLSNFQTCLVTVGGPPVKPPVTVPTDPPPVVVTPPVVTTPTAIRVLFLYESDKPIPKTVYDAMFDPTLEAWLESHTIRGPVKGEWRRFDEDSSLANMPTAWQSLRSKLPASLPLYPEPNPNGYQVPHVVVGDSSDNVLFAGPVPATGLLELLKKYGGQ